MEKLFVFLVFVVVVMGHKHHPKFPKSPEDYIVPVTEKVTCSISNAMERDNIIEQSKCGKPKEVFEYLKITAAHEQVSPRAVWVKRCVGLCDYDREGSCVATEVVTRHIPIRVYNLISNKESCATYPIVEHVRCGCCALSPELCLAPKVFNPRKCSCQCPNMEDRRDCLTKRSQNMRWNRSKCTCEARRRV